MTLHLQRNPLMVRARLATLAAAVGLGLVAGCANPPIFPLFGRHRCCPSAIDCCPSAEQPGEMMSPEGPVLGDGNGGGIPPLQQGPPPLPPQGMLLNPQPQPAPQ